MAKRNIIVSGIYRNHKNWSRVSMGKIDDLQKYINALPEVLEEIS
jgi:histidinol-phosphate aminotransferase